MRAAGDSVNPFTGLYAPHHFTRHTPLVLHGEDERICLDGYIYNARLYTAPGAEEEYRELDLTDYVIGHDWKHWPPDSFEGAGNPGYGAGDARLVIGRIDTGSDEEKTFRIRQHVIGNVAVRLAAVQRDSEIPWQESSPRQFFQKQPLLVFPDNPAVYSGAAAAWGCNCVPCLADPWQFNAIFQGEEPVRPTDPWCAANPPGPVCYHTLFGFVLNVFIPGDGYITESVMLFKVKTVGEIEQALFEADFGGDLPRYSGGLFDCFKRGTGLSEGAWYHLSHVHGEPYSPAGGDLIALAEERLAADTNCGKWFDLETGQWKPRIVWWDEELCPECDPA